ncbi:hypothetical protein DXT77_26945 [Pseudomonas sp. 91RF]|nr:hypothetical protein DXT77_26945 [Pseudomonas sp. 91RF]
MGASLLAMAALQSTKMLNVPTSSRAGSLPQVKLAGFRSPAASLHRPVLPPAPAGSRRRSASSG